MQLVRGRPSVKPARLLAKERLRCDPAVPPPSPCLCTCPLYPPDLPALLTIYLCASQIGAAALRLTEAGVVLYESSAGAPPRRLQLVRGLRNGEGEYNCFLNVIIQSLWHLRPFREALLRLRLPPPPPASYTKAAIASTASSSQPSSPGPPTAPTNGPFGQDTGSQQGTATDSSGGGDADAAVLRALCNIFHALAAPPAEGEALPAADGQQQQQQQQQKGAKVGAVRGAACAALRAPCAKHSLGHR